MFKISRKPTCCKSFDNILKTNSHYPSSPSPTLCQRQYFSESCKKFNASCICNMQPAQRRRIYFEYTPRKRFMAQTCFPYLLLHYIDVYSCHILKKSSCILCYKMTDKCWADADLIDESDAIKKKIILSFVGALIWLMYIIMCCGWAAGPRFGVCVRRPGFISAALGLLSARRALSGPIWPGGPASERSSSAISTRPSILIQSAVCLVAGITLEHHHHHHQAAPSHQARGPISPIKHPFFPSSMYEEPFAETLIEHHAWTGAHSDFGPIDDEYKWVTIYSQIFGHFHSHSLKICVFTYLHRN